jgi:hypothetical protein
MLLVSGLVALIHRKFEERAAICPAGVRNHVGRAEFTERPTRAGVAAMPQFCCRHPNINLTVQLQIGKEERPLPVSMHNRGA